MKWLKSLKDIEPICGPSYELRIWKNCALFRPGKLFSQTAALDSFQFFICQGGLPELKAGSSVFRLQPETVLALPPGLPHSWSEEMETDELLLVLIDPDYIRQVLRMLNKAEFIFGLKPFTCDLEIRRVLSYDTQDAMRGQPGQDLVFEAMELLLLVHFVRQYEKNDGKTGNFRQEAKRSNIIKAIDLMHAAYNRELTLKELAESAHMSRYHFIRMFKLETGMTPFDYLANIKLKQSLDLVTQTDLSVAEVGYSCGFINVSHFSRQFKSKFGSSPKDMRNRYKSDNIVSLGTGNYSKKIRN